MTLTFFLLKFFLFNRIQARRVSEHAVSYHNRNAPSSYIPRESVNDMKSRFGGSSDTYNRDINKNNIYSKKLAPTPPVVKHKKGLAPQPEQNNWQPALKPVSPRKVDPIKEMKMIGQKMDDDVSIFSFQSNIILIIFQKKKKQGTEDDPPFNFQNMLRKTNHKRASMKREGGNLVLVTGDIDIDDRNSNFETSKANNNVVYQSHFIKGQKNDKNANNKDVIGLVLEQEDFSADL